MGIKLLKSKTLKTIGKWSLGAIVAVLLSLIAVALVYDLYSDRCELNDFCLINGVASISKPKSSRLSPNQVRTAIVCPSDSMNKSLCQKTILLSGSISKGMAESFIDMQKKTSINLVCLSSPGGLTQEAFEIGRYIRDNQLSTCVSKFYFTHTANGFTSIDGLNYQCSSSCPFIVQAGVDRIIFGRHIPSVMLHREGWYEAMLLADENNEDGYIWFKQEIKDYDYRKSKLYKLTNYKPESVDRKTQLNDFHSFSAKTPFILYREMNKEEMIKFSLFNDVIQTDEQSNQKESNCSLKKMDIYDAVCFFHVISFIVGASQVIPCLLVRVSR